MSSRRKFVTLFDALKKIGDFVIRITLACSQESDDGKGRLLHARTVCFPHSCMVGSHDVSLV